MVISFCSSLQVVYKQGVSAGILPSIPYAEILTYSFSTALLFHAVRNIPVLIIDSLWIYAITLSHWLGTYHRAFPWGRGFFLLVDYEVRFCLFVLTKHEKVGKIVEFPKICYKVKGIASNSMNSKH